MIGVLKEIKPHEYRVAIVQAGVEQLRRPGHTVLIEGGAGIGSGVADADYEAYGAELVSSPAEALGLPFERFEPR
jgi:alanine dehydrogenase